MIVRKLAAEDAVAYWSIRLEALEREPRSFGMMPEEHRRIPIEQIAAQISSSSSFFVGGFDCEQMIGIARFAREDREKEWHKGHIYGGLRDRVTSRAGSRKGADPGYRCGVEARPYLRTAPP